MAKTKKTPAKLGEKTRPKTASRASNTTADSKIAPAQTTPASPVLPATIVGIGCSAGGLEAMEKFFKHVPANCGMSFVVVQHLDPTHQSALPELIQRFTQMRVTEADTRMAVKANCVYLIPPNKDLTIVHRVLHL